MELPNTSVSQLQQPRKGNFSIGEKVSRHQEAQLSALKSVYKVGIGLGRLKICLELRYVAE